MKRLVLTGGGTMGTLVGAFDWATTPLGPIERWSDTLKSTVSTLLHSRHPMFLWWGPELIQIYNDAYAPSFGIGKHPAALGQRGRECWPEIWDIIGPQIEAVMRDGTPSWHEDALVPIFRNGRLEEVYWTYGYSPVFDDDGSIGGTLVVCTETTGRVLASRSEAEARAELRDSEARFHLLAESIPQLAWSTRPDGHIDWYNQRWYDYTGTTFEDMQGWGWKSVHDPALVDEVVARWQQSLATAEPFEMEFSLRGKDGRFRWHLTRAMPLKDPHGRVIRWFGTNTDIDASREAALERARLLESERQARIDAEHASRAKDDFLATASHELRTPLNAILGWVCLMQTQKLDADMTARAIEVIERNARAQVRLIEDILDGSRIVAGQLQIEVKPIELIAVVQAAVETMREAAEAKRITVTTTMDPDADLITGDAERLQQVVWNLVNNAIKFTPADGRVELELRREGAWVTLTVTDNGAGITAEFLPHVFERFRQAEGSTTRRFSGLGMGLALVRDLVDAHGGSVEASSDGAGRGATFVVRLPVQTDVARPAESSATQAAPLEPLPRDALRNVTVLVVDDDGDTREMIATALRTRGAAVLTAASPSDALALAASQPVTVVVSDIGMPGTDGYELLPLLRSANPDNPRDLPSVALTAYSRDDDRRRAMDAGFQAYASKPVEPERLVRIVADLAAGNGV